MRVNKYVALATGLSRRKADELLQRGEITVNGLAANTGQDITDADNVKLGHTALKLPATTTTILLNKPVGYVVSRDGQGSRIIYDLLPHEYQNLKPVGRLDKDSSGLLLMTNDGNLAHELTHPSKQKIKLYEVQLLKRLTPADQAKIEHGIKINDYFSRLQLSPLNDSKAQFQTSWQVTMTMGRNRQIRHTFAALGYTVTKLHRTQFGDFKLMNIPVGEWRNIPN